MTADVTVTSTGAIVGELLDDLVERANDLEVVLARFAEELHDPATYEGTRFSPGDHGAIKGDPGYAGHISGRVSGGKLEILSSRPYMPRPTEAWELRLTEAIADYVVEGEK